MNTHRAFFLFDYSVQPQRSIPQNSEDYCGSPIASLVYLSPVNIVCDYIYVEGRVGNTNVDK
jgi:hypothetical protein